MNDLKSLQAISRDYSVLYVEDNVALRENGDRLLRKFFHIVTTAKDGEEGLSKFLKHPYHIVITDIKMPKMDGVTLTQEIKKIAPSTHVIVMSAFDDKEFLIKLLDYGAFKFVKKPVNLKSFTDALYEVVLKIKKECCTPQLLNNENQESKEDKDLENTSLLFKILSRIKDTNLRLEMHNYYKGLSITNDAKVLEVHENTILIKVTQMQQKAMQYELKTSFISEEFPYIVECGEVRHISYEEQTVELKYLQFVKTSPIQRDSIRVIPEDQCSAIVEIPGKIFKDEFTIEDISINSIRLSTTSLPAGLQVSKEIYIELRVGKDNVLFHTQVNILKMRETDERFHIVFVFDKFKKAKLMKYITKKQMELIREFKGMQNG